MFNIFIGFIFIANNISIGSIDLLADFIGFFIIFKGLSDNLNMSYKFTFARPISLVLAIMDISKYLGLAYIHFMKIKIGNLYTLGSNIYILVYFVLLIMLFTLIILGYNDIERNEKVNLKLIPLYSSFGVFSVSSLAMCIIVFFESNNILKTIFTVMAISAQISSLLTVIFLYLAFRNYKIEKYNKYKN